jgi:hypothetical protein
MPISKSKFTYTNVVPIVNWGCRFDSLTELKFAISISDEYDFIRSPGSIYYHPGTLEPAVNIRTCDRRYTPDFLIRHKQTSEAFLIEIKPRAYENNARLEKCLRVAENFILQNKYDWKFKVIYDDEIFLSDEQLKDYTECKRLKLKSSFNDWSKQFGSHLNRGVIAALLKLPSHIQVEYLMLGRVITHHGWRS